MEVCFRTGISSMERGRTAGGGTSRAFNTGLMISAMIKSSDQQLVRAFDTFVMSPNFGLMPVYAMLAEMPASTCRDFMNLSLKTVQKSPFTLISAHRK